MRTSPEPNTTWSARLGTVLHHQWTLVALLLATWSAETLLLTEFGRSGALLMVPSNAVAVAVALFARRAPIHSALGLAAVLGSTVVTCRLAGVHPLAIGLTNPTETVAVLLVVLHLIHSRPLRRAAPVIAGLGAVCLLASVMREQDFDQQDIAFGALEFMLTAGTGLYLRQQHSQMIDTPLRQLLSRQWPVIAALSIVLFFELLSLDNGLGDGLLLLCSLVMAGLAVLAPMRAVESAILGAVTLVLATIMARVFGVTGHEFLMGAIPLGALAASMIQLAFTTRLSPPRRAAYAVGALLGSWLFALVVMPGSNISAASLSVLLQQMLIVALLVALSLGTGLYFRARDGERTKSVKSAVTQAQQTERMALARELHDVVAHHVTGIVVQAQAAHMVAAKNPEVAAEAFDRIAHSGTEALTAMRRLVGSMRGAETAGSSGAAEQATTDLRADLEVLVDRSGRIDAGHGSMPRPELDVRLDSHIPHEVARSALRLAQESLTNAEKHALDATLVQIAVSTSRRHLHLRITDDGVGRRAQPVGGSGGYGLVGMRERVELLGGQFKAGPGDHIGWRVEAWLPLENDETGNDGGQDSRTIAG